MFSCGFAAFLSEKRSWMEAYLEDTLHDTSIVEAKPLDSLI